MRAIILAAGSGTRLGFERPKCLEVKVNDKCLLDIQIEVLRDCGIMDVTVVGDPKHFASYDVIPNFFDKPCGNLTSLFSAKRKLYGDVLVTYSDILYDRKTIQTMKAPSDMQIAVCTNWQKRYEGRKEEIDNAEFLSYDGITLGQRYSYDNEFCGILKLSEIGCLMAKAAMYAMDVKNKNLPDLINCLLYAGLRLGVVETDNWFEVDNMKDYEYLKENYVAGT